MTVSWTIFETGLIFMLVHSSHPCQSCQTPPCLLTADLTTSTSWFSITNGHLWLGRLHTCKDSYLKNLWRKCNTCDWSPWGQLCSFKFILGLMNSVMSKIKLILYKYDNPSVCITYIWHNSNIYLEKSKHESTSSQLTFLMTNYQPNGLTLLIDCQPNIVKSDKVKWQIKLKHNINAAIPC